MNENIFANAKFGDKFKMRNGEMAIFVSDYNGYVLASERYWPITCHSDGVSLHREETDIVGRWEDNDGWIPVTEHTMPLFIEGRRDTDSVLFVTQSGDIHLGFYDHYTGVGFWECNDCSLHYTLSSGEVTHWRPLPKAPNQ